MRSSILTWFISTRVRAVITVVLWLVLIGVLSQIAPSLDSVEDNAGANLPAAASDSMQARELAQQSFPDQKAVPAIIVVDGPNDDGDKTAQVVSDISAVLSGSKKPEHVVGVVSTATTERDTDKLVSDDGSAQLVVVPIAGNPSDKVFQNTVDHVRQVATTHADTTQVAVTGPAGISTDTVKVFGSGDKTLLFATITLVLVILLAIYRSPLMALIPLAAAGVAMRAAESAGALMADAGWLTINSQTASIMTVLLFGVGTDYALIITARYREALVHEPNRYIAMQTAMRSIGETVLSSASTIVLAMFALLVAVSPSLRGFGPYLALGVATMTLVAFTFIPALTLLFGRAVFWPATATKAANRSLGNKWWRTVADAVVAAPKKIIGAVLVLLFVLSLGLLNYQQSFDFISGFRVDTDSAYGQELIRKNFSNGEIAPTTVLIRSNTDLADSHAPAQIRQSLEDLHQIDRVGAEPQVSADGHTASFEVVLDHDPYSAEALDVVEPLQKSAETAAIDAGVSNPEAFVSGETAETADTRAELNRDMLYIIPLVLVIVAGILGVLLRSLLAPVYLVGTLLLSFLATLGATTFFTLTILGDVGIGNRVTAYIFIFLISLGVDYNIFIMSRYKQEVRTRPSTEAIPIAITRTGGVVSSAGLILAATFTVLMTQPIRELFQFGFAMAFGILLDTFIIRPLLVPAIVKLLGKNPLWPKTLPVSTPTNQ